MIVSVQDPIRLDDQSEPQPISRSSTIETISTLMRIRSPMMCSW